MPAYCKRKPNTIHINAHNSSVHEIAKVVLGLIYRKGADYRIVWDKKMVKHIDALGNYLDKRISDMGVNSPRSFITEAQCKQTRDIIDLVVLDSGEEQEIIKSHGLEKAKSRGRTVVKV